MCILYWNLWDELFSYDIFDSPSICYQDSFFCLDNCWVARPPWETKLTSFLLDIELWGYCGGMGEIKKFKKNAILNLELLVS